MQHRSRKLPFPPNMIFLREAIEPDSLSFNKDGDLVKQAIYTRKRGREMEQFIVITRQGSAMYFHMIWDQALCDGDGDWTAINALACADLEELYETAGDEVKRLLDGTRWE